jgi:hypothetical protein
MKIRHLTFWGDRTMTVWLLQTLCSRKFLSKEVYVSASKYRRAIDGKVRVKSSVLMGGVLATFSNKEELKILNACIGMSSVSF